MSDLITRQSSGSEQMTIFDENDEKSVYNLVPNNLKNAIDKVPEQVWELSFSELSRKAEPTVDWKKARLAFWLEYERAVRTETTINLRNVSRGILGPKFFTDTLANNFYKLVYVLTPPENYTVKLEEMLILALDEERKILEQPLIEKKFKFNKKNEINEYEEFNIRLGDLKHKIRESLLTRLQGAPVQRTINKNINENIESKNAEDMSVDELETLVKDLREEREKEVVEIEADGGIKDDDEEGGVTDD